MMPSLPVHAAPVSFPAHPGRSLHLEEMCFEKVAAILPIAQRPFASSAALTFLSFLGPQNSRRRRRHLQDFSERSNIIRYRFPVVGRVTKRILKCEMSGSGKKPESVQCPFRSH